MEQNYVVDGSDTEIANGTFYAGPAAKTTAMMKYGLNKRQKQKDQHSEDTDVSDRLTGRQASR